MHTTRPGGTRQIGALLLTDARLPGGGHAYSAGLEPGLRAGVPAAAVPDYIAARLRTVGLVEASATVLAHRAVLETPRGLAAVHDALLARTPSAPLRDVSGMLGRGLVRLVRRLAPDDPAVAHLDALGRTPQRPVVLGVAAAVLGASEEQAARASLYDDAQTVASASLKLAPVDPVDAAGWVLGAEPLIEEMVATALAVTDPADMPATAAPQADQWSLDHQRETRRLFVA
ncbi:urease accessory protein UreF [Tomitella gaofuii]|uniref:urease accessory protein UreF n=1 Tax=Tomitella gaofuii TaxID=2760083 RepID=UPI002E2A8D7D|nr:urease accessory UreF family protein [Tomitella gaofuii]